MIALIDFFLLTDILHSEIRELDCFHLNRIWTFIITYHDVVRLVRFILQEIIEK